MKFLQRLRDWLFPEPEDPQQDAEDYALVLRYAASWEALKASAAGTDDGLEWEELVQREAKRIKGDS